jgi:hypothetical protein
MSEPSHSRPIAAPVGSYDLADWPVDVQRADASGEIDLGQLEFILSLTPCSVSSRTMRGSDSSNSRGERDVHVLTGNEHAARGIIEIPAASFKRLFASAMSSEWTGDFPPASSLGSGNDLSFYPE